MKKKKLGSKIFQVEKLRNKKLVSKIFGVEKLRNKKLVSKIFQVEKLRNKKLVSKIFRVQKFANLKIKNFVGDTKLKKNKMARIKKFWIKNKMLRINENSKLILISAIIR